LAGDAHRTKAKMSGDSGDEREDLPASFGITGRYARQINYVSPPGDFASSAVMPVGSLGGETV